MGVPAFFRWLTKKYPSVIVHCVEDKPKEVDGVEIPVATWEPNPNGVEFDNLYLDMNGIIHPCTHPEDKPAPKNEDEMMIAIFECIDRLFRIVRPRKVLYMAIDGVAPRAKMNQQRSRRFRASKEVVEKIKEMDRIREELISKGCELPPAKPKDSHFDSNCITPGTPFMDRLSKCLHYYIHDRLNNDAGWKGIKVILSDANVPGEGEHKIMDYIRRQRAKPEHDPNTSHCLCGADADLIMLGLATHEPNFTIIREEFKPNKPRPCEICNQIGHEMKDCLGIEKEVCGEHDEISVPFAAEVEFIFVRINVLREYLEKELTMVNLPFPFELERAVDDWVFMCFFVGNDFLPHLPSLEIRENAIDRLVELYKKTVYKTGGWLTNSGVPDLTRVQLIMSDLGEVEDEIFRNRQQNELRFKARMKAQKKRKKLEMGADSNCYSRPAYIPYGQMAPVAIGSTPSAINNARQESINMRKAGMHTAADGTAVRSNHDAAAALKSMLFASPSKLNDSTDSSASESITPNRSDETSSKRKLDSDDEEETNDEVRLWEAGFKDRYYESKFDVQSDNYEFRQEVATQYVRGLSWVLRYYYQTNVNAKQDYGGCASWEWYFPYHYAPFASDFINIGDMSSEFEGTTKPFSPLEQLMGVFPAASRSHVPPAWGELMTDPESPIIDFYPEDFQIDLNGKKFAWQGVALLPFVDEVRLKQVLAPFYDQLTDEERRRNIRGDDRLYVRKGHDGFDFLNGIYENSFAKDDELDVTPSLFQGVSGKVLISGDVVDMNEILLSPISGLLDVMENQVTTVRYRDPKYEEGYIFPAVRLEKAVDPPKVLKPGDLTSEQNRNWRPQIGMARPHQRASLDSSGHRMLSHEGYDRRNSGQGGRGGRGFYNNMAPPTNSYVHRNDNRGEHRSRPYDANQRGRGYHPRGGNGGYNRNSWPSSNGSGRGGGGYYNSDGGGYAGQYNRGGHQGGSYSQSSSNQARGHSYSHSSYGYSTVGSTQSYSSAYQQQERSYSTNVPSGGAYSAGSSSQQWRDRSDRDSRNNERDGGRRHDGYYTSGYTTTTGSGNGNNSRR